MDFQGNAALALGRAVGPMRHPGLIVEIRAAMFDQVRQCGHRSGCARGASGQRLLTDIVSLVRYALHQDNELVPYRQKVEARYETWLQQQQNQGRHFTPDQQHWLNMIRDHIANSLEIDLDDFDYTPFTEAGGLGKANEIFGNDFPKILTSLNKALAA